MSHVLVEFFTTVQAQSDVVRLAHGTRCGRMCRQESRHADEDVSSRLGATAGMILFEGGIDHLERMETRIFPQHSMTEGGQETTGVGVTG